MVNSVTIREGGAGGRDILTKIGILKLQIEFFLFLRHSLINISIVIFSTGLFLMIFRMFLPIKTIISFWYIFLGLVILSIGFTIIQTKPLIPNKESLRTLIEKRNNCGGLLVTAAENSIQGWEENLVVNEFPVVRWYGGKIITVFLLGIAFLLFTFFLPDKNFSFKDPGNINISPEIKNISSSFKKMEEEDLISQETTDNIIKSLQTLENNSLGNDPEKTLEALDQAEQNKENLLAKSRVKGLAEIERLANLEAIIKAISDLNDSKSTNSGINKRAMKDFAKMLKNNMANKSFPLPSTLSLNPNLLKALEKGTLTANQMKKLMKSIQKTKADLLNKMTRLKKLKFIDAKYLKICHNAGKCRAEALKAFLQKEAIDDEVQNYLALANNANGGISRGRGDADITFGEKVSRNGFGFKNQHLPASIYQDIYNNELLSIEAVSPISDVNPSLSSTSSKKYLAPSNGGRSIKSITLPQHKSVVKKYFKRK